MVSFFNFKRTLLNTTFWWSWGGERGGRGYKPSFGRKMAREACKGFALEQYPRFSNQNGSERYEITVITYEYLKRIILLIHVIRYLNLGLMVFNIKVWSDIWLRFHIKLGDIGGIHQTVKLLVPVKLLPKRLLNDPDTLCDKCSSLTL